MYETAVLVVSQIRIYWWCSPPRTGCPCRKPHPIPSFDKPDRVFGTHKVRSELAEGELSIAGTPAGERMRLTLNRRTDGLKAVVVIDRAAGPETLVLSPSLEDLSTLESKSAPDEPHEFNARLILSADGREEIKEFHMAEPVGHAR